MGSVWPRNSFMAELARKTPTTLLEFMDQADGFINAEDTLWALTKPRKTELEQTNKRAKMSVQSKTTDKAQKE